MAPYATKEIVVRRQPDTWSFHLPARHRCELSEDRRYAEISTPAESSTHRVVEIIENADEVCVVIEREALMLAGPPSFGPIVPEPRGYPFPAIDAELARLESELMKAGGDRQQAQAWATGAGWDSHTRHLRAEIRRLAAGQ